jgi:hypothetical protein
MSAGNAAPALADGCDLAVDIGITGRVSPAPVFSKIGSGCHARSAAWLPL